MLKESLQRFWGYDSFRPLQERAMRCVLSDRDSVVVLPTGGGKSLCYQVPAVCRDGLAVVVSPLISLMKDQVDALECCGVPAAVVNSTLSFAERREVAEDVRHGKIRLLYFAPERLVQERTLDFLARSNLQFVAIDEAHCISEWGHDFRPEYRQLKILRERFPKVALHAYTATATERVRHDIASSLGLREPEFLIGSFDRSNLFYRVERRTERLRQVSGVLDRHRGESGIVYCISRKDVDSPTDSLNAAGYRARAYHAGLSDSERKAAQEDFIEDRVETIVATVAFGMGIDTPNVRYVVPAGLPMSLENYQQESGRAGRDGLEAECCLFFSPNDARIWRSIIAEESGSHNAALASLAALDAFCTGVTCRHEALVSYFGQSLGGKRCQACDVCLGDVDLVDDALTLAQKILSGVIRVGQRFGGEYVSLHLHCSKDKRLVDNGHDQLSTHGLLAEFDRRGVRDWIEQRVGQGLLVKEGEYNVLKVTPAGRAVLRGEGQPRLLKPRARKDSKKATAEVQRDNWEGVDRGLFDELKSLRRETAEERGVPAYVVFGDTALRAMARQRPSTLEGFRAIRGVGDKKLADYGEMFLARITDYCERSGIKTDVDDSPAPTPPPRRLEPSHNGQQVFALFRQGRSLHEICEHSGRTLGTVTNYLCEFLRHEQRTDPAPWVDTETFEAIRQAVAEVGPYPLRPIFEHLGEQVPFEAIRIALACLSE
jgi:ATP-dependent DNA helicase RecQ